MTLEDPLRIATIHITLPQVLAVRLNKLITTILTDENDKLGANTVTEMSQKIEYLTFPTRSKCHLNSLKRAGNGFSYGFLRCGKAKKCLGSPLLSCEMFDFCSDYDLNSAVSTVFLRVRNGWFHKEKATSC